MKKIMTVFFAFLLCSPAVAATVKGTVVYDGERPKFREIKMDADPICLTHHDETVYPRTLVLGENMEMKNVFVHIAEGLPQKDWPVPEEPLVLDQQGCMYDPPVFGVMVNQPIKILNPDGTLHNVHAMPKVNKEFNVAMPNFRKEITKSFDKPELWFPIKCDVHPWMVTYANVLTHPFYATTDETGQFEIADLPPGDYVIEARQQKLPPQRMSITVGEGEDTEVNFTFSRPDKN